MAITANTLQQTSVGRGEREEEDSIDLALRQQAVSRPELPSNTSFMTAHSHYQVEEEEKTAAQPPVGDTTIRRSEVEKQARTQSGSKNKVPSTRTIPDLSLVKESSSAGSSVVEEKGSKAATLGGMAQSLDFPILMPQAGEFEYKRSDSSDLHRILSEDSRTLQQRRKFSAGASELSVEVERSNRSPIKKTKALSPEEHKSSPAGFRRRQSGLVDCALPKITFTPRLEERVKSLLAAQLATVSTGYPSIETYMRYFRKEPISITSDITWKVEEDHTASFALKIISYVLNLGAGELAGIIELFDGPDEVKRHPQPIIDAAANTFMTNFPLLLISHKGDILSTFKEVFKLVQEKVGLFNTWGKSQEAVRLSMGISYITEGVVYTSTLGCITISGHFLPKVTGGKMITLDFGVKTMFKSSKEPEVTAVRLPPSSEMEIVALVFGSRSVSQVPPKNIHALIDGWRNGPKIKPTDTLAKSILGFTAASHAKKKGSPPRIGVLTLCPIQPSKG
jgi:hypothetical protein